MAGIFTLESSLNFIIHCPKIIVRKILNFLRCVGKKTALLQAEASACVRGLQMCSFVRGLFIISFFLSLSSKLSVRFCLFSLTVNGSGIAEGGDF